MMMNRSETYQIVINSRLMKEKIEIKDQNDLARWLSEKDPNDGYGLGQLLFFLTCVQYMKGFAHIGTHRCTKLD